MRTSAGRSSLCGCVFVLVAALALVSGASGRPKVLHGRASMRDTTLPTWQNLYDWPDGHGYVGWHSNTGSPDDYGVQAALGGQPGLWLWPLGGHKTYDAGDGAEWTYTAPGTTRLEAVTLSYAWTNKLLAHHCIDIGFRDAEGNVLTHEETCKPPPQSPVELSLADPASNPTAKVLYFQIHVDCGGALSCDKTIPTLDPLKNGAYARLLQVDMTLVDDDLPDAGGSGSFYELGYSYIDGTQSYDLTAAASDAGSGIQRVWVERLGDGALRVSDAPCDPTHHTDVLDARICPQSYSYTSTIDTSALPEGRNDFAVQAVDVAGNLGTSYPWHFYVDRTAPAPVGADGFSVDWFDRSAGEAAVGWSPGNDPELADGSPGSGIGGYSYRYALNGGGWSAWTDSDKTEFLLENVHIADAIDVQVTATDNVGNTSAPSEATVEITDAAPPPPDVEADAPSACKDATTCDEQIDPTTMRPLAVSRATGPDTSHDSAPADPPASTRSWYEETADTSTLQQQGCDAAKRGLHGATILDFGRPAHISSSGVYGTLDFGGGFVSTTAAQRAAQAYVRGYVQCSGVRAPSMKVAIGTTNGCTQEDHDCCPHQSCGDQVPDWSREGTLWARAVNGLGSYIRSHPSYARQTAARGASDMEPAWMRSFTRTGQFLAAYNAEAGYPLYDYGSADPGFWSLQHLYDAAYGRWEWPFPEVYLTSMAADWHDLARFDGGFGRPYFSGILSQWKAGVVWVVGGQRIPDCGLTPADGYRALLTQIPQTTIPYVSDIVCQIS